MHDDLIDQLGKYLKNLIPGLDNEIKDFLNQNNEFLDKVSND